MDTISPVLNQQSFRGRGDTQTLNSATFDHALNADFSQAVDTNFRVRFLIQETAGGESKNKAYRVEYDAGGGYAAVTDSTPIQYATSGQYSNGDPTSQVLGGGSFVAGDGVSATGTTGTVTLQSEETEHEFCLTIDSAQVDNDDTIDLQVALSDGTPLDNYNEVCTVTVVKTAAARRVFVIS